MVTPSRALRLVRMPGEFGPILRCSGELSAATVEALRRELAFLEPLCRPVLTLNLSDCGCLDLEGVLAVLQTFKALREKGRHLVVVAEAGPSARLLRVVGINGVLPVLLTVDFLLGRPDSPTRPSPVGRWACGGPSGEP